MLGVRKLRATFCFFERNISEKYGKKCCRYNQDGKPLPLDKVETMYGELKEFLTGWKIRQDGRRLVRHFFLQDYPRALKYLEEVVQMDKNQFRQCPTFKVENGQLLTLQLYSVPLQGLSNLDFRFALRINNIPYQQFALFPIENEKDYRFEASMMQMERQAKSIQKQLDEDFKKRGRSNQTV